MSPEQLTAKPLTASSDVYSLGMVAVEMLVGGEALPGGRLNDQLDRLVQGHTFNTTSQEHAAPNLHRVIQKMTARRPEMRYAHAGAALADLAQLQVPASPVIEGRRRVSGVAVALAIAALVLVSAWAVLHEPPQAPVVPPPVANPGALLRPSVPQGPPPVDAGAPPDSGACGPLPFVGRGELSMMEGIQRTRWTVYVPRGEQRPGPLPLLILLHDNHQPPLDLLTASGFQRLADAHGFFVMAPRDSSPKVWLDEATRALLRAQFEVTASALCVDRERVFIVSQGQGGRAAEMFGCEPWVAGVATNSFTRTTNEPNEVCDTPVPRALLLPMESERLPPKGGRTCKNGKRASFAVAERSWRTRNECTGDPVVTAHGSSTCYEWQCKEPLMSCRLDGGFGWPGTAPRVLDLLEGCDGTPPEFPTAQVVWEFLSRSKSDGRSKPRLGDL